MACETRNIMIDLFPAATAEEEVNGAEGVSEGSPLGSTTHVFCYSMDVVDAYTVAVPILCILSCEVCPLFC